MSIRKIRKRWWVDFRIEGKRYRKMSPENSAGSARAYEILLRKRLARGEQVVPKPPEATSDTFSAFASTWLRSYVTTNNKPSEQENKESVLRCHLVPFFKWQRLAEIDTAMIEDYKASRRELRLSEKTINNHLTVLRCCLGSAHEKSLIPKIPHVKWFRPDSPDFDFLSLPEIARLLAAAKGLHPWRGMLTCAVHTGMRLGELTGLDWSAVNIDARQVTVRKSLVRGVLGSPKTKQIRYLPMNRPLHEGLTSLDRRPGLVFLRPSGHPISATCAYKALQRICRRAGLRRIGWHVLRHTFASQLVMRGVPLRTVQTLLGHSTIQMTERYAHLAPEHLQSSVAVLDDIADENSVSCGQPVGNARAEGVLKRPKRTAPQTRFLAQPKRKTESVDSAFRLSG